MAKDLFKPFKCTKNQLFASPLKEGQIYFLTDTKQIYMDAKIDGVVKRISVTPTSTKDLTNDSNFLTTASNLSGSKITGTIPSSVIPTEFLTNNSSLKGSKITGEVPLSAIPASALERLVIVDNKAARLKLTKASVQIGDTVQELDTKIMYRVIDDNKLNSESGYKEYTAGTAAKVPWSGVQNKPESYPPSSHKHSAADITSGTLNADRLPQIPAGKIPAASLPSGIDGSKVTGTVPNATNASKAPWTGISGKPDTFPPSSHTHTKAEVGLGNVENKSSATIRSEISSSNVTTALGYAPVKAFSATGTVSNTTGTPSVKITKGGTATDPTYAFAFTNIKGDKGDPGKKGADGSNGAKGDRGATGNGIESVTTVSTSSASNGTNTYRINFTDGNHTDFTVKNGSQGPKGGNGSNGTSCTHSWNGTKLTVNSASGSSTADLKGEKGDKGNDGLTTSVVVDGSTYTQKNGIITLPNRVGKSTQEKGEIFNDYVNNTANQNAHAEGQLTQANGIASHAEGYNTIASSNFTHVQGRYNLADSADEYAHIIGNGHTQKRSNAHTLSWNGTSWYQGDVRSGGESEHNFKISLNQLNQKVNNNVLDVQSYFEIPVLDSKYKEIKSELNSSSFNLSVDKWSKVTSLIEKIKSKEIVYYCMNYKGDTATLLKETGVIENYSFVEDNHCYITLSCDNQIINRDKEEIIILDFKKSTSNIVLLISRRRNVANYSNMLVDYYYHTNNTDKQTISHGIGLSWQDDHRIHTYVDSQRVSQRYAGVEYYYNTTFAPSNSSVNYVQLTGVPSTATSVCVSNLHYQANPAIPIGVVRDGSGFWAYFDRAVGSTIRLGLWYLV